MTMPDFMIIGAPRTGSTSLYHYLNQHPNLFLCTPKEPMFFTFEGGKSDLPWLTATNNVTTGSAYQALFRPAVGGQLTGEASTLYLYSPGAPARIKACLPDVKLIALLRQPVDRAYSHFCMRLNWAVESEFDFTKVMFADRKQYDGDESEAYRFPYRQISMYYAQLKRYFDWFQAQQIRIYLYEDYQTEPALVLEDIFNFLGVNASFKPDMTIRHHRYPSLPKSYHWQTFLSGRYGLKQLGKRFFPARFRSFVGTYLRWMSSRPRPMLSDEQRQLLTQLYRVDILKLQNLLERDLTAWLG